jgi:uncharacterized linocin/CFP29 family protein
MDHLRRPLAPVPDTAWAQIEDEAKRTLALTLAARRVVDVVGPTGWQTDALTTGLVAPIERLSDSGVDVAQRLPIPFLELRAPFDMSQAEVDSADRGNPAIDTGPVVAACRRIAIAEDALLFHGDPAEAGGGIVGASPHPSIDARGDATAYPDHVALALQVLRDAGVNGPYALVVGDEVYTSIQQSTEHGFPIREHLAAVLYGGPILWSSALRGAIVLSTRGGDFELALGQDLSVGYAGAGLGVVSLYIEESVAFRVLTPEAAVHLAVGVEL